MATNRTIDNPISASNLTLNTATFNQNLSGTDTNVQTAMETIDNIDVNELQSTLTTGSVPFVSATSGKITQDNANFYYDDTNNCLGIGTNIPAEKLEVYSNQTSNSSHIYLNGDNGIITTKYSMYFSIDRNNVETGRKFGWLNNGNGYSNATEIMTLLENGNLGIGVTSPTSKLDIYNTAGNTIRAGKSNGYGAIAIGSQTTDYALIESISGGGIQFYTGNGTQTVKALITESGCFGIGGTPTHALEVVASSTIGNNNTAAQIINNGTTNPYGMYMALSAASPNNTTQYFFYCPDNAGLRFVVWSNGSVQNATGSYGVLSDIKLKENIVDATPKLDKLLQLRVVNYNLKADENKTKLIGFVAQEVEQVMAGLVEDTEQTIIENGKPKLDENGKEVKETVKSIKSTVLIPMLVKGIQEQQEQINELKQLVKDLSSRIDILESK